MTVMITMRGRGGGRQRRTITTRRKISKQIQTRRQTTIRPRGGIAIEFTRIMIITTRRMIIRRMLRIRRRTRTMTVCNNHENNNSNHTITIKAKRILFALVNLGLGCRSPTTGLALLPDLSCARPSQELKAKECAPDHKKNTI